MSDRVWGQTAFGTWPVLDLATFGTWPPEVGPAGSRRSSAGPSIRQTVGVTIAVLAVVVFIVLAYLVSAVVSWRAQSEARRAIAVKMAAERAERERLAIVGELHVSVKDLRGIATRWVKPSYPVATVPLEKQPGEGLAMPANKDVQVYLGAALTVVNEGDTPAKLHVTGWPQFGVTLGNDQNPVPPRNLYLERAWALGDYQLAPRSEVLVVVRDGPTLGELVETGGLLTAEITLSASDIHNSVRDSWVVRFSGRAVTNVSQMSGDWMVAAWAPTDPTMQARGREHLGA